MNIFRKDKNGLKLLEDGNYFEPFHQNEPTYIFLFPLIGIFFLIGTVWGLRSLSIMSNNRNNTIVKPESLNSLSSEKQQENISNVYPLPTGWQTFIGNNLTLYYHPTYSIIENERERVFNWEGPVTVAEDEKGRQILLVVNVTLDSERFEEESGLGINIRPVSSNSILNKRQYSVWKLAAPSQTDNVKETEKLVYLHRQDSVKATLFMYDQSLETEADTRYRILTMIATSEIH
jgi:hypothetical protein